VDEAHLLSAEILEELRLLSNLETTDDKLLQIVLAGQPELDETLDSFGLRQLKQRIAVRTQLCPLDADETRQYIQQRLQIAGKRANETPLFSDDTVAEVFRYSRGLPRLINTICENGLITAYARQMQSVTPEIVEDVAKEFRLNPTDPVEDGSAANSREMDFRRAMRILLERYSEQ
jgi:general secretion pathway protein A